ncbi:MAG: phosphoribosylformylglycinamidine cyclo-ligase [Candidatus Thorarchaeota archaeon]
MVDVLVIAGSKSDEAIVDKAKTILDEFGISYKIEYASAHREPDKVKAIVTQSDAKVMIAIAGLSAALPGVVASYTDKPVIGVPVNVALDGLDALLAMMQMPKGVPVATVGIDNGQNAAHLATRILGVKPSKKKIPTTYAEAGVDESLVAKGLETLGKYVRESFKQGVVLQDFGHYANTVKISDDLCLAVSTDGVGSKVLVAEMVGRYDSIGIDCVAMNVNDLICIGATPIAFVDYLASEAPLPLEVIQQIGQSLLLACNQSEIPILGGETAILPDMIRGQNGIGLDLAGTAVGIAKPEELFDGSDIRPGDVMIGIASNGIHSNGFTLARKVLFSKYNVSDTLPWDITLGNELLRPTAVYVPHFKALRNARVKIKGMAHITGSGFRKILRLGHFKFSIEEFPNIPPIFSLIQNTGNITWKEMFATFNMGIGLVVVVPEEDVENALKALSTLQQVYRIGKVEKSDSGVVEIIPYGVRLE